MTYKRKIIILSALVVVLAAIYTLILVLDRKSSRSDAFAWLDSDLIARADGIEIVNPQGEILLKRKNNVWVYA